MLTIRHIDAYGREEIWQTVRVVSEPGDQVHGGERNIFAPKPDRGVDDPPVPISTGRVYVMNDAGKTVATYHLVSPAAPSTAHTARTLKEWERAAVETAATQPPAAA